MRTITTLTVILLLLNFSQAQDLSNYNKIADYPFSADGNDITNINAVATTLNTTFDQGGIYSNGIYGTGGSVIKTPQITSFNPDDFALQFSFRVDTVPSRPIFVAGDSWRWLKIYTEFSVPTLTNNIKMSISKSNGSAQNILTTKEMLQDTWYTATVIYSSPTKELSLYIDSVLIKLDTLDADFNHHNNFNFSNVNGGFGFTLKGYWKDLKIYNKSGVGINENNYAVADVYYNSYQKSIVVRGDVKDTDYALYSISGKLIDAGTLNSDDLINVPTLKSGVYFVHLTHVGKVQVAKIVIGN